MKLQTRIIALILTVLMLAGSFGTAAWAESGQLTVDERRLQLYEASVKEKYEAFYRDAYHGFLMSDGVFLGAQIVRDIEADGAGSELAEWAAERTGERLNKEQWALYLAAQMAMQEEGFCEAARSLAEYDSLKSLTDYTTDVVGMASAALDLQKFPEAALETISDWIGVAADLLDGTADGLEKYRDMLTLVKNYENHALFLNAVAEHAGDEALKEAAAFLLEASDKTMALQKEADAGMALSAADAVGSNLFADKLFDYLKSLPEYADDPQIKRIVDEEENTVEGLKWFSLAHDLTLFGGDMILGTTDVFKRYLELVAVSGMAEAMQAGVEAGMPGADASAAEILAWAREYVPMMQAIVLLRMRGEYCAMAMIYEDAQAASLIERYLGEYEKAIDFYNDRTQFLGECWEKLNDILAAPPAEAYSYQYRGTNVTWADLDGDGLLDAMGCSQDRNGVSVNINTTGHGEFTFVRNAPAPRGYVQGADLGDGEMTIIISQATGMAGGGGSAYLGLFRPVDGEYVLMEDALPDQAFEGVELMADPVHYVEPVYVEEKGCYDLVTWQCLWPYGKHYEIVGTGYTQYRLTDDGFAIVKQWTEMF